MIVVAIIGVLAALAIYGVSRYLAAAKSAEAKEAVGAISRSAVSAFEEERVPPELLGEGAVAQQSANLLCGSAIPVPLAATSIQGKKYQPDTALGVDFQTGTVTTGWQCLSYMKAEPMTYRYTYFANGGYLSPGLGGPDPGATGFEAAAQGDLDGDTQLSTFARVGALETNHLRLATQVFVDEEFE